MDDVDPPDPPELVAVARQGNPAAFERLVSIHRRELFELCYRMLGSRRAVGEAEAKGTRYEPERRRSGVWVDARHSDQRISHNPITLPSLSLK